MLDWEAPGPEHCALALEDYASRFIGECVRRIQQRSGQPEVSLLGYCMGGVLSLIYTTLNPEPVKNLVAVTTPIDFSKMELFRNWADPRFMDIDQIVDTFGQVPAPMILQQFKLLRPISDLVGKVRLWDNLWNDEFARSYRALTRWGNDPLPLAGEYARQTTQKLMQGNQLHTHELQVDGRRVDYRRVRAPLLAIIAQHDHIVPYAAAQPLVAGVASTDKEEVIVKGGHVSVMAGAGAVRRVWPKINEWLAERST
jgi:polyhydroxyalkanoate synthase